MNLLESIKKPFLKKKEVYKATSTIPDENIDIELDSNNIAIGFKDETQDSAHNMLFNTSTNKFAFLIHQRSKIQEYRKAAENPDVHSAITDIINEASFSEQRAKVIKIDIDEENTKIKDTLNDIFDNIYDELLDLDNNIYYLMEHFYIDGQLNVHLKYKKGNIKEGIKEVTTISPFNLYYDKVDEEWNYMKISQDKNLRTIKTEKLDTSYSKEEIVRIDSGIYDLEANIIKGWLEPSIKSLNQLNTLEDLLIPLRFSRSTSRRVFNIDVGDMPPNKAESYLNRTKSEFKYKKYYNPDDGTIKNNQHVNSMVEDYWFANRSGARGTTVDVLDETGNLGELDDILHFQKKIYTALGVPKSRAPGSDESDMYSPNNDEITQEDMKFLLFVMRFRNKFIQLVKEIFKRDVLAQEVMTADEFKEYKDKINFYFENESKFYEKMKQMNLMNQHDIYTSIKEDLGTKGIYSYEYVFKNVFNLTEEEMKERLQDIKKESESPELKHMYQVDNEDF